MSSFNTAAQRVQREIKKIVRKEVQKCSGNTAKHFGTNAKNFIVTSGVYTHFPYTQICFSKNFHVYTNIL